MTWVASVRCLPPAPIRPASRQWATSRSNTARSKPWSTRRVRNLVSTVWSKPVSVSSAPIAYFQSMARTVIAAACRSVRFSVNCRTVTSDNSAGDIPGAPRTPKASTNGSSANTSASRSRTRIGRLPFGNAARATATVCSGAPRAGPWTAETSIPPRGHSTGYQPRKRSCRQHRIPRRGLSNRVTWQYKDAFRPVDAAGELA